MQRIYHPDSEANNRLSLAFVTLLLKQEKSSLSVPTKQKKLCQMKNSEFDCFAIAHPHVLLQWHIHHWDQKDYLNWQPKTYLT